MLQEKKEHGFSKKKKRNFYQKKTKEQRKIYYFDLRQGLQTDEIL
jgi:hypothetical protein